MDPMPRRSFLQSTAAAGAALGLGSWPSQSLAKASHPRGKAEHCIMLWLGGGAAQTDTWDPKRLGNPKRRRAGSAYPAIETAVKGVKVTEHLSRTARIMDRCNLMRTVHHSVIDEHAAATNRMHTGRPTSGTIQYPSFGSIVSAEKGPAGENVPRYVVMGYPNLARDPGFLGARHGYIYLTQTATGPNGLVPPPGVDVKRMDRRRRLMEKLRKSYAARHGGDEAIRSYAQVSADAFGLMGKPFMSAFDLDREPKSLRAAYGSEFGQRCLLARRLIQRGVRFLEVSHNLNFLNGTGWDTHNAGQLKQHELIQELDKAFATLVHDLEKHKLLDKTLIIINTEFGRPSGFDGGGGRGHQSKAFSVVLAGGGLKGHGAVGQTDDLCRKIVQRPVSVPDLFATACCALGIDPSREMKAPGDRPVPITDAGEPVRELFV
ncbi:MAG: DUF1501 domain-containing protein [Phycisphaeraceae bacterium]|nr:DUF1501 domain-containing protein [Phycisphaeraceae bacterium]